ncbi:MAG: acetamidase/formamidase family protein [Acidobacteria bacterium]|nr:acetamidase/formamidase family protein [Acidobacteriota bacterium]
MTRTSVVVGLAVVWMGSAVSAQPPGRVHALNASPSTTHIFFFDASLEPVLRVDPGDVVRLETATGNPRWFENAGVPRDQIPAELFEVYQEYDSEGRGDHTLNGPIFVNGAEPGDVLEVRILSVDVRLPIAGQGIGRRLFPGDIETDVSRVHWIDLENRTVEFAPGVVVPIKPFWGVIGVAPPREMGRVPSGAPNFFGGNMDNRDLGAGSTLYLPVHNPGALLSVGDGHAVQGYGEISGSAVETSLRGEIQVFLHKNQALAWPRAETPTHYMTMGLDPDLDEAARLAAAEMVDFLVATQDLDRETAILLCSVAMDMVVTQVVDGTKGIHAMIAKDLFRAN